MVKFFKSLILFIVILIIFAGIGFSIYYFSPEIKPGEYGVVYKVYGNNKGFTGKILSPGKYYYFISGIIPGFYKIYKIEIKPEYKKIHVKLFDGSEINLELVYNANRQRINDFIEKINNSDIDKILNVYFKSAIDQVFLNFSLYNMVKDNFTINLEKALTSKLNRELSFFGLELKKIKILNFKLSNEKQEILAKLKQNKIELQKLALETEKKVKEEKILNKLKLEKLNFLLKKAEIEKEITRKNVEKTNIYWEAQKERLKEEVNILSKPGGEYATKLEAIRMIVNGLKSPQKVKQATEIVNKILNH